MFIFQEISMAPPVKKACSTHLLASSQTGETMWSTVYVGEEYEWKGEFVCVWKEYWNLGGNYKLFCCDHTFRESSQRKQGKNTEMEEVDKRINHILSYTRQEE